MCELKCTSACALSHCGRQVVSERHNVGLSAYKSTLDHAAANSAEVVTVSGGFESQA